MRPSAEDRGIYVHLPYCLAKCGYCAFNSYATSEGVPDAYVAALVAEARRESAGWPGGRAGGFVTAYLGGGTPSVLSERQLADVMASLRTSFGIDGEAEVTLEANPVTVDRARLEAFRRLGVTRLSVGVQSLSDHDLVFLGRLHGAAGALRTLEAARQAGFENVSADVMIGIPGQTRSSLGRTLEELVGLVDHLSVYILTVEAGTPLAAAVVRGEAVLPDDDTVARLCEVATHLLAREGFERYETSNWCRPGRACRHNLIYWSRGNYVGLGAGAHSHRDGLRYAKFRDPRQYIAAVLGGASAVEFSETLSAGEIALEEMMLALRTSQGMDPARLTALAGPGSVRVSQLLDDLARAGLLVIDGNKAALSPKGLLVGDAVAAEIASLLAPAAS